MHSVVLNDSSSNKQEIPVCPNCNKYPILSLLPNDPEKVLIDCPHCQNKRDLLLEDILKSMNPVGKESVIEKKCEFDANHSSQQGTVFCTFCEKWLCDNCENSHSQQFPNPDQHRLSHTDKFIESICKEHKIEFNSYCTECRLNLCKECVNKHEHQSKIISTSGVLSSKQIEKFNTQLLNMRNHSRYINLLFKKVNDIIDEYKKQINDAFEKAKAINNNILKIYDSFISQSVYNKVNYHIYENLEKFANFSFKSSNYDSKNLKLEDLNGVNLKEYKTYLEEGAFIAEKKSSSLNGLQKIKECTFSHFVSCLDSYRNKNDEFIILGFNNGTLGMVNFKSKNITKDVFETTDSHKGSITSIKIYGNTIYTAASDFTIRKWEIKEDNKSYKIEHKAVFIGHKEEVNQIIQIPGKNTIISCSEDGTIRVWEPSPDEITVKPKETIVTKIRLISMLLCKDNEHFITINSADVLTLWSLNGYKEVHKLFDVCCCSPRCLVYKEDDILVYGDKMLTVVSFTNGELKIKEKHQLGKYINFEQYGEMFSIIPTEDNNVILSTLRKSLLKINLTEEQDKEKVQVQVKDVSEKRIIEGVYRILTNKYAIVFGKTVALLSN